MLAKLEAKIQRMGTSVHLENMSHQLSSHAAEPRQLFRQFSMHIESEERLAIVGDSGSGKSTLMSILAGLRKPSDGKVTFICSKSGQALDVARFRQRCSFIFQQFYLVPELDAMHNVALPLTLRGDSKALNKSLVWLDKVGLAHVARVSVTSLSTGEQQRVAIARALISEPEILFADEPVSHLDRGNAVQMVDLINEFCKTSATSFILATRDIDLAKQVDRCVKLAASSEASAA
ncbi:ABC transporter ATP-binding protein [Alteromonas sp. CYL-A6]|uniref:ABC transporter ATP-binding protein n=1 Tax=Alteromonas nitratireducens TaxID=3390813 RepID=UPI0034C49F8C